MNNGKLQAKQEKLKFLHCPSPRSSLFNSRGSSLRSQFPSLIFHSPAPNPAQSAKSSSISSKHSSKYASSPQQLFIDMSTELLRQGQSVRFRAPGLSMHPAIKEGETITVVPISSFDIKRGDILLYLAGKKVIAHRVVRIKREKSDSQSQPSAHSSKHAATSSLTHSSTHSSKQASTHSKTLNSRLIFTLQGDASPICDEPVEAWQILGKVVSVERQDRKIDLYSRKARILHIAYTWASRLKRLILSLLRKWSQIFIFDKKHGGILY